MGNNFKETKTGHGYHTCGAEDCKGKKCGGDGNANAIGKKQRKSKPFPLTPDGLTILNELKPVVLQLQGNETVNEPDADNSKNQVLIYLKLNDELNSAIQSKNVDGIKEVFRKDHLMAAQVASSDLLTEKDINQLRNEGMRMSEALLNPNLSLDTFTNWDLEAQKEAMGDKKMLVQIRKQCTLALRLNPKTPNAIIFKEASEDIELYNDAIRMLGSNLGQGSEAFQLQRDHAFERLRLSLKHPSIKGLGVDKLMRRGVTSATARVLLENPNCEGHWINSKVKEYKGAVKEVFLQHPKLSQDNITKYADSEEVTERLSISINPSASRDVIAKLCNDTDSKVSKSARNHANAPKHYLDEQINTLKNLRATAEQNLRNTLLNGNPLFDFHVIRQAKEDISGFDKELTRRTEALASQVSSQAELDLSKLLG
ncbi:MAG: hypothetical protein KF802_02695 [Bdellovibrionaceae bacterium]|nr:hypothetical protein [Pseudobdellovibrionaceae bacterium]